MTDDSPPTTLDLRHEVCPMTFVRTRLALDRMAAGEILTVRLRGDDPVRNVAGSARRLGHTIVETQPDADGETHRIVIRKAG